MGTSTPEIDAPDPTPSERAVLRLLNDLSALSTRERFAAYAAVIAAMVGAMEDIADESFDVDVD